MKASELIERLQALMAEHGDLDVRRVDFGDAEDRTDGAEPIYEVEHWPGWFMIL